VSIGVGMMTRKRAKTAPITVLSDRAMLIRLAIERVTVTTPDERTGIVREIAFLVLTTEAAEALTTFPDRLVIAAAVLSAALTVTRNARIAVAVTNVAPLAAIVFLAALMTVDAVADVAANALATAFLNVAVVVELAEMILPAPLARAIALADAAETIFPARRLAETAVVPETVTV
jgi:hypothetical protein